MKEYPKYTRIEREILHLVMAGKASKEIAYDLELTQKTVNRHIRTMYRRAGLQSRHELMVWTMQQPAALLRDGETAPGLHPPGCTCPALYCVAMRSPAA